MFVQQERWICAIFLFIGLSEKLSLVSQVEHSFLLRIVLVTICVDLP